MVAMPTTNKHPARLYLDESLMGWLRAEAARRHCSLSQVVRDLIVDKISMQRVVEVGTP